MIVREFIKLLLDMPQDLEVVSDIGEVVAGCQVVYDYHLKDPWSETKITDVVEINSEIYPEDL